MGALNVCHVFRVSVHFFTGVVLMRISRVVLGFVCIGSVAVVAAQAGASIISYEGFVEGTEVSAWRTTSVAKTMDNNGDNRYGTLGAANVPFGSTGGYAGQQLPGSATLGWALISYSVNQWSPWSVSDPAGPYAMVDKMDASATEPCTVVLSLDETPAQFEFQLTGTAADYAGKKVRVGIMGDVLQAVQAINDNHKGLQVVQTLGGTGDSGVISLRAGGAGDQNPELYFFDLTGATAGDRFQIRGLHNVGGMTTTNGVGGNVAYVGPICLDVVPEPNAIVLLSCGLVSLLAYVWRKRR